MRPLSVVTPEEASHAARLAAVYGVEWPDRTWFGTYLEMEDCRTVLWFTGAPTHFGVKIAQREMAGPFTLHLAGRGPVAGRVMPSDARHSDDDVDAALAALKQLLNRP